MRLLGWEGCLVRRVELKGPSGLGGRLGGRGFECLDGAQGLELRIRQICSVMEEWCLLLSWRSVLRVAQG